MKKQSGMTFLGMVFMLVPILFMVIIGLKVVPAYIEFASVQKAIDKLKHEPNFSSLSNSELKNLYAKTALIDNIDVVKPEDLIVFKSTEDIPVVTADYQKVIPLFYNASVLLDFVASTDKAAYDAQPKQTEAVEAPAAADPTE